MGKRKMKAVWWDPSDKSDRLLTHGGGVGISTPIFINDILSMLLV